jgi:hypothetical protein
MCLMPYKGVWFNDCHNPACGRRRTQDYMPIESCPVCGEPHKSVWKHPDCLEHGCQEHNPNTLCAGHPPRLPKKEVAGA